jgi:hypothetical protein
MKKKPLLIIAIILAVGGLLLFYIKVIKNGSSETNSVTNTVQTRNNKNADEITVTGKAWFEDICPPNGAQGCTVRVYLISTNITDVKSDTPKIALTKDGVLEGCGDVGSKECAGFTEDKTYTVQGTLNTNINLGTYVKVVEVKFSQLTND